MSRVSRYFPALLVLSLASALAVAALLFPYADCVHQVDASNGVTRCEPEAASLAARMIGIEISDEIEKLIGVIATTAAALLPFLLAFGADRRGRVDSG